MSLSENVAKYYDDNYNAYVLGWSRDHLHFGMWNENVSSHAESLVNTIDEITKVLEISSDDIVLDAGCGVGGASRHISN